MRTGIIGFVCGVLATILIMTFGMAYASGVWKSIDVLENDISIVVDGKTVPESNFMYDDRTYIPLRAVSEMLGKNVTYDEESHTAYINNGLDDDSVAYSNYSEIDVPDYGVISGHKPLSTDISTDDGIVYDYYYIYDQDGYEKYINALKDEGFLLQNTKEQFNFYVKDSYFVGVGVEYNMVAVICRDNNDGGSESTAYSKPVPENNYDWDSEEGVRAYLQDNYSSLKTSVGTTKFTYTVTKNEFEFEARDYWIQVEYDSLFEDILYGNKYTLDEKETVKSELKDFQEKLGRDLIKKAPGKKFWGCYYNSWYKYPSIKVGLEAEYYCNWTNYDTEYDSDNAYYDVETGGFRWWPLMDIESF